MFPRITMSKIICIFLEDMVFLDTDRRIKQTKLSLKISRLLAKHCQLSGCSGLALHLPMQGTRKCTNAINLYLPKGKVGWFEKPTQRPRKCYQTFGQLILNSVLFRNRPN